MFVDRAHDVVGLYLDPLERALVLCVDEKSQIQALDRSQSVLPTMPGVPEWATHDTVRAGTTSLFAAFDTVTGQVIGLLHRLRRAAEFKKFLAKLGKERSDRSGHRLADAVPCGPVVCSVGFELSRLRGRPPVTGPMNSQSRTPAVPRRPGGAKGIPCPAVLTAMCSGAGLRTTPSPPLATFIRSM